MSTTEEIRDLLHRYAHHVDRGPHGSIASMFTADGRVELGGRVLSGRDEIAAFYAERAQRDITSRHVVTNMVVDQAGPDEARVTSTLQLFREFGGPVPVLVADYHDDVVRVDGRWLFANKRIEVVFSQEGAP